LKAVVFGGSGFLGSHVADVLTEKGYEVTIFDIRPSQYIQDGQKMFVGDLLDYNAVKDVAKDSQVLYNFAGVADIDVAYENPLDTIKYNILGNAHVLEAIKYQTIKRYVFASTVYVYSDAGSFYRSSKQACELYIEDYAKKYGIPYTIVRYGSLYGPRADEHNPIFNLLKKAILEKKISYWGNGQEIREYIHVEDAARCSSEILDENFINQNVIFSGHHPIRSRDLLVMINEIIGNQCTIEYRDEDIEHHYRVTPYSFNPKIGRKYISHYYLDMGQGLLQCVDELYRKLKVKE